MRIYLNLLARPTLSLYFLMFLLFSSDIARADVSYSAPLNGEELQIGNILEWATDFETNSKFFVVQRSLDGISYENIGKVDAAGISEDNKDYHFMDVGMIDPKAYYRLKQVDNDGTSSFSQTVVINKKLSNNFMILSMSSPEARDKFEIVIDVINDSDLRYQLTSIDGETIIDTQRSMTMGINNIVFNLENEVEGAYKIKLQSGDEVEELLIHKYNDDLIKKPNVASKNVSTGG